MAILEKLFERRDATLSLTNYKQWVDLGLASGTASGVTVTPEGALMHSAVYACVRILAETVASLPLIMYERLERGKRRAEDHYLYALLKDQPNECMTSFEYRETLQGHLALWGNAYSLVDYDSAGRVTSLFPLRPDRMLQIVGSGDRRLFHYMLPSGEMRWFDAVHIWHLRGMGSDGLYGYSPIHLARQAIGLGMAAEEYGARFFSNGAEPGVVLQHPGPLSDDAYKRIRKSWEKMHQGLDNKHRMAIVEEGMTVEKIGIPPDDAQFLETRKFQLQEIARIYRIPPHMLADLDRATFSNIEHQGMEFMRHTARPWLVRWEQSIKANLMLEAERKRFFPEFLVDALLRGDTLSRYQAYAAGRQNGWLSANDVRELENMNPVEGGDVYLVPINMTPAEQISVGPAATQKAGSVQPAIGPEARKADPANKKKAARERLHVAKSYGRVFEDVGKKAVKRELHEIKHAAEKFLDKRGLPAEFEQWVRDYYREFPEVLNELWSPAFFAIGEAIQGLAAGEVGAPVGMTPGLDECLRYHINRSIARHATLSTNLVLAALAAGDGSTDSISEAIADWPERRPAAFAGWETIRTSNLMAKATYFYAGATGLEWIRLDENPFCPSLEGRIIEMGDNCRGTHFVLEGDEVPARSKRSDVMTPSWNVSTPPLFEGCECQIAPIMPDIGRAVSVSMETRSDEASLIPALVQLAERLEAMANGANGRALASGLQAPAGMAITPPIQVVVQPMDEAVLRDLAASIRQASQSSANEMAQALEQAQQRLMAQYAQAETRLSGQVLAAIEMVGRLVEALRSQGPPKTELHIEPAPVQVISQPTFPHRMVENQKVLRDKKGQMVGTVGERKYFEE